jgi:hypothetical protein
MLTSVLLVWLPSLAFLCLVLFSSWRRYVAAGQLDALYQDEDAARARNRRRRANRPPLRLPAWRFQQRVAWRRLIAALHQEARRGVRLSVAIVPYAWPGPRRVTYPPNGGGTRAMWRYVRMRTYPLLNRLVLWRRRPDGRQRRDAATPYAPLPAGERERP